MQDELDDIPVNTNRDISPDNDFPTVYITSFGKRRGPLMPTPQLSIDLRDLPNPPKALRSAQTGLSKPIRDWIFTEAAVQERFESVCGQIKSTLDAAKENGETEVVVGVNCEIGKHRSVAFVEELGRRKFPGWNVVTGHRDVNLKRSNQKHRSRYEDDDSE